MTDEPGQPAADEVRQTARTWNFDAYLAATLAPSSARNDLIAIAAFVGELERIRLTVSEPALAQIRIQWWRDEFQRMARDGNSDHPIGAALAGVIKRHSLPTALLIGVADAIFDLVSDAQFTDDQTLNAWLTKRHAAPFELAVRCLAVEPLEARDAIGDAGRGYGLARLLHEIATQPDMRMELGIQEPSDTLFEQAEKAGRNVSSYTAHWPRRLRSVFLPIVLVPDYLAAAKVAETTQPTPFCKVRRMAWAHWVAGL